MTAIEDAAPSRIPQDAYGEEYVLGSMMLSPVAVDEVTPILSGPDFYRPAHETIYAAILGLHEHGTPIEMRTVADRLEKTGDLARIGGPAYLHTLVSSVVTPVNAGYYARSVQEKSVLRRAAVAGERIVHAATAPGAVGVDVQALAEDAVASIAAPVDETTWSYLDEVLDVVYAAADEAAASGRPGGIAWGIKDVDREMAPMVPGEFAVLSAFSGGGKSVAAGQIALHAAVHQGKRVLLHAMEMTRLEVGQRWVAAEAHVELERVINGRLSPHDQEKIDRANARMLGAPLVIDEVETVTLATLRASVRKHKPEFVVVDQIPTMTPTDTRATREQQVSAIAYGLKGIAQGERVPLLACCQLNGNPTKRSDRTPTMHDVRESQAITHAANTLVILSDPMDVDKDSARQGEIDFIIRKRRQGPKDVTVPLARLFHYGKLGDLA